MVNKPIYIAASLLAVFGMISFTASGHFFSAFAQGSDVTISMVPGASTMADKGYSPNPAHATVGQKVTWVNNDSVQHTVTSGTPGSPDSGKEFDSGLTKLLNHGDTFSHTFTKAGDYSFYCQLHPTMLGHLIVK